MPDNRIVLVFWAESCDEMVATTFVTSLRRQGVRVKLVGVFAGPTAGITGVALLPDITLEQAIPLAGQASAVIVPGGVDALRRLDNDPRVRDLLRRAAAQQALFITSTEAAPELASLLAGRYPAPGVVCYPDGWGMIELAHSLGDRLGPSAVGLPHASIQGTSPPAAAPKQGDCNILDARRQLSLLNY